MPERYTKDVGNIRNMEIQVEKNIIAMSMSALKALYEKDSRPWVVAYSGGKDSTAVLQLVYSMLLELKAVGKAKKHVFVISSDTKVESPNVAEYVADAMRRIEIAAKKDRIPLTVRLVSPESSESFWGKLIGLGYPPPTRWFRWCTTNMKIKPSRRAIDEITQRFGSIILLLGSRSDESAQRALSISIRDITNDGLNRHHEIPNALTFKPIVDWSTDEVWEYLYGTTPPWGGDHEFMLALYRKASGGECPVVLDLNTPSCGGSRFGCWTCTVVKEDKSMQGFIDSGDTTLQPLKNFRDWLKIIREEPTRRSPLRRNGNSAGPGPFNPITRKEILTKLFETEKTVGFELISNEDLNFIQLEWRKEFDYNDSVRSIALSFGREIVLDKTSPLKSSVDNILESCAVDHDFPPELAHELLDKVKKSYADLGRWGAKRQLEDALAELIKKDVRQAEKADAANDF